MQGNTIASDKLEAKASHLCFLHMGRGDAQVQSFSLLVLIMLKLALPLLSYQRWCISTKN